MLKLNDSNKSHLNFLTNLGQSVLNDFCKLSWEYIVKGPNAKFYNSASQKLSVDAQVVQHVVEALANLLVEACKHKISLPRLKETLTFNLGFSDSQAEVLCNFYAARQCELSHVLLAGAVHLPTFKELEWRIDAQVGTRGLPEQVLPEVLLRLSLDNWDCGDEGMGKGGSILLKTDPGNLVHITKALDRALEEATSQHARRVQRRFKAN